MPKCFSVRASLLSGAAVLAAVLPFIAMPAPAYADGGEGGSVVDGTGAGGLGGSNSDGVAGAAGTTSNNEASGGGGGGSGGGKGGAGGGQSGAGTGGAGGTATSPNGAAGGTGSNKGGGGGGGGGYNGDGSGDSSIANTGTITGGNGGAGGNGASGGSTGGGGGGAGGYGVLITGSGTTNTNSGTISGGNGGAGGSGYGSEDLAGNGGDGGVGITVLETGATLTNTGTISGGNGGAFGTGQNSASNGNGGLGGVGITGFDLTIVNDGTIAGGLSGATSPVRADAIQFTGGINTVVMDPGSTITGDVVAYSASDTLELGGSGTASFDVSTLGPLGSTTAQYLGFGVYEKTGTSDWTLTGSETTVVTDWQILAGTLSVSSDANLGYSTSTVTFDGGTLQFTSSVSSARTMSIAGGNGTIDNDGNTVTLSGVLSGTGALTSTGAGTLVLTGADTYTGGTTISAGTLQIGNGGTTGSITGNIVDNAALVFDVDAATSESGVISGTGTLTQEGTGVLTLTGTNTYTGGTTVTGGLVDFTALSNFGAGATPNVTLNGGGLQWASGTALDISSDLKPIGTNGGTFDTNGNNVSFATALTGTGGVTKAGTGVLTFTVANTYSGGTTVTGGLIDFNSLSEFGTKATPNITLNGGGLQWASGTTLDISSDLTAIGANGGSFDTNGNNVTLATAISGNGGITKLGTGTLTLTASETYTGATTVSAGTLQIGNGAADGALAGDLVDNATVVFDRPDSVTFAGAISGTGTLIWDGPGTLTLTGNNSFTGSTVINGPLVIDASGSSAVAGNISGSGSVTQAGSGVLVLGGNNTYTGGTFVTNGLVNFASVASFGNAAAPNITLNGGGLQWASGTTTDISSDLNAIGSSGGTFDTNGSNVSFASALTGTGGVTKTGTGVLTFTVANSYSGGTTVTGGLVDFNSLADFGTKAAPSITLNGGGLQWASGTTLDISSDLTAIGANGATFDTNSNTVTLATALTGTGGLTKIGAGTLTLTPTEGYTGATLVTGGTLVVNGSIAASSGVTVIAGGKLGGSGTISSLVVGSGGTIQPGAAGGTATLTVSGTVTFNSGSTYAVNLTNTGNDKLVVSGSANLGGAALVINPTGTFSLGEQFTVLTAAGGLGSSTFGSIATTASLGKLSNGAALVPVASYNGDDVIVTIDAATVSPFLPSGVSTNAKNVAASIDVAMVDDNATAAFAPLTSMSQSNLLAALASLSGEVAPSAQDQTLNAATGFLDTLTNASNVGNATGYSQSAARGMVQLADNGPTNGLLTAPDASGFNVWGALGGAATDTSANTKLGTHATNGTNYGGVIGVGYRDPDDRATVGMALSYSDVDWSLAQSLGKGRAIAYQGGVYGAVMYRQAYVSAQAMVGSYAVTTTRTVSFGGTNVYQGKVISDEDGVRLELGRHFVSEAGWFTPYLSGSIAQLDTPAYAEKTVSGSSTYALGYTSTAHTDLTSELGAAYDTGFGATAGELLTIHARLGWLHDYAAGIRDSASFQGFTSPSFLVYGAAPSKDAAHLLLGVEQDWDGFAFTLDAQGLLGKSSHSIGGNAGIALRM